MTKQDTVHISQEFLEIGKALEEARKEKGLSIEKVAARIHIRKLYLRAIEAGDLDALPGGIYTVGFVKVYSNFLGLDGEEFSRRLNVEDIPIRPPEEPSFEPERLAEVFNEANLPSKKTMIISGAGLAVIAVIVIIWKLLPESLSEMAMSSGNNAELAANGIPDEDYNSAALGMAPAPARIPGTVTDIESGNNRGRLWPNEAGSSQNSESIGNNQANQQHSSISSGSQTNNGFVSAGNSTGALSSGTSNTTSDFFETTNTDASLSGANQNNEIAKGKTVLKATKTAWIRIRDTTAKNKIILTKTLQPGEKFTLPKQKGLTIHTGNAGGIDVFIGGKRLGRLGAPAQIARKVNLDQDALRKRIAKRR